MKKEEVIKLIGEDRWKDFNKFMNGQTFTINKDGTYDYYVDDVERFIKGLPVVD